MFNSITTNTPKFNGFMASLFLLPFVLIPAGHCIDALFNTHWLEYSLVPLMLFGLLPLADALIGQSQHNPIEQYTTQFKHHPYLRTLPLLGLPAWLILFTWVIVDRLDQLSTWQFIGMAISLGIVAGVSLINVAHELIHRNTLLERRAGGLLLACTWNLAFKIEHVRGHHLQVATPADHSSAALWSTPYSFIPKAFKHNYQRAFQLEKTRLHNRQLAWYHHEILYYAAFSTSLTIAVFLLAGWQALLLFGMLSLIANLLLELVNYVEHYGLSRKKVNGQFEKVSITHSWNSNHLLTNSLLLNLARHSDHHANAGRPYFALRHHSQSPQLPAGYSLMVIIALYPPLWRKLIHPRLPV